MTTSNILILLQFRLQSPQASLHLLFPFNPIIQNPTNFPIIFLNSLHLNPQLQNIFLIFFLLIRQLHDTS